MDHQSERLGTLMAFCDLGLVISTYGVLFAYNYFVDPIDTNVWIVCSFFLGIKILILGIADITGIGKSIFVSIIFIAIAEAVVLLINQLMAFYLPFRMLLIMAIVDVIITIAGVLLWKSFIKTSPKSKKRKEASDWIYDDLEVEPNDNQPKAEEVPSNAPKTKTLVPDTTTNTTEEPGGFIFGELEPIEDDANNDVFTFTSLETLIDEEPKKETVTPEKAQVVTQEPTSTKEESQETVPEEEPEIMIAEELPTKEPSIEEIPEVAQKSEETKVEEKPQVVPETEVETEEAIPLEHIILEEETEETPVEEETLVESIPEVETPIVEETKETPAKEEVKAEEVPVIVVEAPEETKEVPVKTVTETQPEETKVETKKEPEEKKAPVETKKEVETPKETTPIVEKVKEEPKATEEATPVIEETKSPEKEVPAEEVKKVEEVKETPKEEPAKKDYSFIDEEEYEELTGVLPKLSTIFEPISVDVNQIELNADRDQIKNETIRLNDNLNKIIKIYNESLLPGNENLKIQDLDDITPDTSIAMSDRILRNKLKEIIDRQFVSSNVLHDLINITNTISNRAYSIDVAENNIKVRQEAEKRRQEEAFKKQKEAELKKQQEEQKKAQKAKEEPSTSDNEIHFQNEGMDIIIDKADLELLKEYLKQQDANN